MIYYPEDTPERVNDVGRMAADKMTVVYPDACPCDRIVRCCSLDVKNTSRALTRASGKS